MKTDKQIFDKNRELITLILKTPRPIKIQKLSEPVLPKNKKTVPLDIFITVLVLVIPIAIALGMEIMK